MLSKKCSLPSSLQSRLDRRKKDGNLRYLVTTDNLVDLASNDYLGLSSSGTLLKAINERSSDSMNRRVGSTGSRLLSGNSAEVERLEDTIAKFHKAESALIFSSGYAANVGLLASIATRHDTVLYDELVHASIRDGISLAKCHAYSFRHHDLEDLQKKSANAKGDIYVVVESLYSMDGDFAPLKELAALSDASGFFLIVDEAHATGIYGGRGEGLVVEEGLESQVLARVHTFGKALGCHGAAVLGPAILRDFFINFSRPFIYSTAPDYGTLNAVAAAYSLVSNLAAERAVLLELASRTAHLLRQFNSGMIRAPSPIQTVLVPGNPKVKDVAQTLRKNGIDIRPILSPTVPVGSERLRICLHSFNRIEDIEAVTKCLSELI